MSYVYGTGSYWKGSIGSATFIIDSTDVGGTKNVLVKYYSAPGPRTISGNVVSFEIHDFEPSRDGQLEVLFNGLSARDLPVQRIE